MGERLDIEIIKGGQTQANAYYHWSGYTSSAIHLTNQILEEFASTKETNKLLLAIRLLETTGAGLALEEVAYLIERGIQAKFAPCVDRNTGIIGVSEERIEKTRYWEEHRVDINLDTQTIDFSAIFKTPLKEWEEEYETPLDTIPIIDGSFDAIPFAEFSSFGNQICDLIQKHIYRVRIKNDLGYVYSFVE